VYFNTGASCGWCWLKSVKLWSTNCTICHSERMTNTSFATNRDCRRSFPQATCRCLCPASYPELHPVWLPSRNVSIEGVTGVAMVSGHVQSVVVGLWFNGHIVVLGIQPLTSRCYLHFHAQTTTCRVVRKRNFRQMLMMTIRFISA